MVRYIVLSFVLAEPDQTFDYTNPLGGGGTATFNGSSGGGSQIVDLGAFVDISFLATGGIPGGGTCFSGSKSGPLDMQQDSNDPNRVIVNFFFTGLGSDGTTAVKYFAQWSGVKTGTWLPSGGISTMVALDSWDVRKDTGKGKNVACEGSGGFVSTSITVTEAAVGF